MVNKSLDIFLFGIWCVTLEIDWPKRFDIIQGIARQHSRGCRNFLRTYIYMSPRYAMAGLFFEKSDIYSFGVLMLEIICGKNISRFAFGDDESKGLLAYAWESWCKSRGTNLLDIHLDYSWNAIEVARCVQVGILCVQQEDADRPNILDVLSMITSTTDLPITKQPIFAVQTQNVETSNYVSSSKDLFSVNDLTHYVIQGQQVLIVYTSVYRFMSLRF
ncbi:BnaA03g60170D [Brassica napus]|uniref:BnaA03g60170D protein n=2 Tax=Brassica TaxID=3705 RepID=A0A078GLW7_BRANA|nr:BnaA03g60170D [Brassica napus]VDC76295.1 unnamed protein product [Brassica rapa]